MKTFKTASLKTNSFHCRWRIIKRPGAHSAVVLLPGGPGLSTEYLEPWAKTLAATAKANIVLLEYPLFQGKGKLPLQDKFGKFSGAIMTVLQKVTNTKKSIFIGHSFGCRMLLKLINSGAVTPDAVILMNCPTAFKESESFSRRKSELKIRSTVKTESDFRSYWKTILPLYFYGSPKSSWLRVLTKNTSWTDCSWMADLIHGQPGNARLPSRVPILCIHGADDIRFPSKNRAILKKLYPSSHSLNLENCGHFPMLETPGKLCREVTLFLSRRPYAIR
ncbi:alpha/beta hydrolase [Elusimicrobiota bacterium]